MTLAAAVPAPSASPWERIDYATPVPDDFLVPEHHWPALEAAPLERPVRVRANHLALRFSCEMFVHFERYVIEYLERYRSRTGDALGENQLQRFIDEERLHVDAFHRLLRLLRPDLYPDRRLRFLSWSAWDRWMLRVSPEITFFTLAALFEEMTLFVPVVMDERAEHSFAPVHQVMNLHAREERGHVALDERVLEAARARTPRWLFALQVLWSLPLMLYVDRVLAAAWRRAMQRFAEEEGLTRAQAAALRARKPSRSDVMGIRSFIEKVRRRPFPGGRILCFILEALLR